MVPRLREPVTAGVDGVGYSNESLALVVDNCMRYTTLYMARYNVIVARIRKAASTKFEVLSENQAMGDQGL